MLSIICSAFLFLYTKISLILIKQISLHRVKSFWSIHTSYLYQIFAELWDSASHIFLSILLQCFKFSLSWNTVPHTISTINIFAYNLAQNYHHCRHQPKTKIWDEAVNMVSVNLVRKPLPYHPTHHVYFLFIIALSMSNILNVSNNLRLNQYLN